MGLPDDGLRAELTPLGWRQGSVLAATDVESLKGEFRRAAPGSEWPQEPVLVVLTQTCDLLHDKLLVEPVIDVVVGETVASPDKQKARNQNPRELDIAVTRNGVDATLRLYMRLRAFLRRDALVGRTPCPHTKIDEQGVDLLVRWIRDRYSRTALPDAFDRRILTCPLSAYQSI